MIIKNVDVEKRLFAIENFLPDYLLKKILQIDWQGLNWSTDGLADLYLRRTFPVSDHKIFGNLNKVIDRNKKKIEKHANVKFYGQPSTVIWYNQPGFTVPLHTDGHVQSGMQIYLSADSNVYGTTFYNFKNKDTVKHRFKFESNCGYLLLNGLNNDGSQPLQWHGMLEPVKKFRISVYTMFGNYKKF